MAIKNFWLFRSKAGAGSPGLALYRSGRDGYGCA